MITELSKKLNSMPSLKINSKNSLYYIVFESFEKQISTWKSSLKLKLKEALICIQI